MRRSLLILGGSLFLALAACGGSAAPASEDSPASNASALTTSPAPAPEEDPTKKECPWASATDSSCAVGTSEAPCGNGTGKCGISGNKGCTCISTVVIQPGPIDTTSTTTAP